MTTTLDIRVSNLQGVSERNPLEEARISVTKRGRHGRPTLLIFSEASFLNAEALADAHDMYCLQFGERGSPEAGVAILSAYKITHKHLVVGTREVRGEVRMRPIIGGRVLGMPVSAIHAPPPRTPAARAEYVRKARQRPGCVGGDWNYPERWMHSTSTRGYRGDGVVGLLVPDKATATEAVPVGILSDHKAVDTRVKW